MRAEAGVMAWRAASSAGSPLSRWPEVMAVKKPSCTVRVTWLKNRGTPCQLWRKVREASVRSISSPVKSSRSSRVAALAAGSLPTGKASWAKRAEKDPSLWTWMVPFAPE